MAELEIKQTDLKFVGTLTDRQSTDRIFIHHSGDNDYGDDKIVSAEQIHQLHINKNNYSGIGYHIVIKRDGTLEQGRPLEKQGAHAASNNSDSIAICLCGSFMGDYKPPAAQLEILPKIISALCDAYNIPYDRNHIVGHREVNSTSCPGDNLYPLLNSIVEQAKTFKGQYKIKNVSGGSSNKTTSEVPLYKQFDDRWADVPYGSNCMASSGCGPTCMAMILGWYGKSDTPDVVAKYFQEKGWAKSGTDWAAFTEGAKHWGIEMKSSSSADEVKAALLQGSPVIVAHPKGMFTGGGHILVYAKLSGSDNLIINNPGSPNSYDPGPDDKIWSFSTVIADANNDGKGLVAFIPVTSHEGISPNSSGASTGTNTSTETKQEIKPPPLYKQYDKRWRELSYGKHKMKNSGSGPTCMAMILGWYGKTDTPDKVAEYFIKKGWDTDSVTVDSGK